MNIRLDGDEQLDRALEGLVPELQPRADLWPAISADIAHRARRSVRWSDWPKVAAAAAVLIAVNVAITLALLETRSGPTPQALAFREPVASGMVQAVDYGGGMQLGPSYLQDRQDLRRRLDDALDQLDPSTHAALVDDVAGLRAAQTQIAEALLADPDNAHLQRMLIRSLEDEVVMLSQIERLAVQQGRRNDL